MRERIQRQEKILDRQLDWIRAADAKIPPVIVLNAAMLASLAATAPPIESMGGGIRISAGVFLIFEIASLLFLIKSIFPNLAGPTRSVVYFGGILKLGCERYKSTMEEITDEDYLSDLIAQSIRNAEIARTKFSDIRIATSLTICTIVCWTLTLYLFLGGMGPFN